MRVLTRACYVAVCLASALFVQCAGELRDEGWLWDHRSGALLCAALLGLGLTLGLAVRLCKGVGASPRARLRLLMRALPFEGSGAPFAVATALLTGTFSVVAHLGEHHTFVPHGDALMSLLTAVAMAIVAAVLSFFVLRVLRAVVASIVAAFSAFDDSAAAGTVFLHRAFCGHPYEKWPPPLFNRPPPLPLLH